MQSFRTELEDLNNPVVARDIIDLERKIRLFRDGKIDDDKFRSLRLVRGIYGQRQPGVQMIRIKLPLGRVTTKQLRRIAAISDEYASSNPTPYKFFPDARLAPFIPAEFVKKNRQLILEKAKILREYGVEGAFIGYEPNFMPAAFLT